MCMCHAGFADPFDFQFVVKFEIVLMIPAGENLEEVPTGWNSEQDFQFLEFEFSIF